MKMEDLKFPLFETTEQDVDDVLNNLKEYKEEYVTSNEIRKLAT